MTDDHRLCNCLDNECHAAPGWTCRKKALTSNHVNTARIVRPASAAGIVEVCMHNTRLGKENFCSQCPNASFPPEIGPKPDAQKAPVISADPCPTGDWVHEEHNGKCVYCGAPMPSQSKASCTCEQEDCPNDAPADQCCGKCKGAQNGKTNPQETI